LNQMSYPELPDILGKEFLWIGVGFSGLEPGQAGRAVIVEARFQNRFVSDQLLGGEPFRAESGFNVGGKFRNRPIISISTMAEEPIVDPRRDGQPAKELANVANAISNFSWIHPGGPQLRAELLRFLPEGDPPKTPLRGCPW